MKKLLYITHLSGKRVNRFWISSIKAAESLGYEFHLACNMNDAEHPMWEEGCEKYHIITHQIDFDRNPLKPANLRALSQLKALLKEEQFEIVHCNTPVGGLIGRIASHKVKVSKVIYQAHGFHFWKGAPLKNWLFYYPVERFLARFTDVLITINQEDYRRAQTFKAKRTVFVPGVGIDLDLFSVAGECDSSLRSELGIPSDAVVLLSVGELIPRKNHRVLIECLPSFPDVRLVICGRGPLLDEYRKLASSLGVSDRVIFTGFMSDIEEYYRMADIFVFPSKQEGLSVSVMEAMASGLPCVVSDIRGNSDLIEDESVRFPPDDKMMLTNILNRLIIDKDEQVRIGMKNLEEVKKYRTEVVVEELASIYSGGVRGV